jgi:hypothetical protein
MGYARAKKLMLIRVESGTISITQNGRLRRLQTGQYAFFGCGSAIRLAAVGEYQLLSIFIPTFLLEARLRNMQAIIAQPFASTSSPWRIAANLVRLLANEIRHIPAPMAYGYANQVVELVSVAVEADAQCAFDSGGRNAIFKRCAAFVKGHLADSSLDPNKIADAMGISVRYLHKVFQESDESVCEYPDPRDRPSGGLPQPSAFRGSLQEPLRCFGDHVAKDREREACCRAATRRHGSGSGVSGRFPSPACGRRWPSEARSDEGRR